jgi:hypothetical protein
MATKEEFNAAIKKVKFLLSKNTGLSVDARRHYNKSLHEAQLLGFDRVWRGGFFDGQTAPPKDLEGGIKKAKAIAADLLEREYQMNAAL